LRTKKFVYNSISFAGLQLVILLSGFILPRLYITTYGSEINGLISSIVQFVSYFNYVEAGLGSALIYALYKPLAECDTKEINGIVLLAKKSYVKASGVYLLLVMVLSILYPFMVKSETTDPMTIALLVLVIGLFGALDFFTMAKYRVLLTADQKIYVVSLFSILALLVNFTVTILLIKNHANIVLVRLVPLVSFIIRSLLFYTYMKYKYPFIKYDQPVNAVHLNRRWDALILQLSISLNLSVPVVLISIFCSLKMASVFAVYSMVFTGLIALISIFTTGLSASLGDLAAKKEFATLRKVHTQFEFFLYGVITLLYSSALILISPFISIYTKGITDINYVNSLYGVLFVIWGILHNIRIPYTALVNAAGLYRETREVNILQVVILLILSLILVQFLDITGVLLAMIAAALYRGIDLILVITRLAIKSSPAITFVRITRIFLVVITSYLPFHFWIRITASTLYEWLIWAFGVVLWCGLTALLANFLLERQVFMDTFARIKKLIPQTESDIIVSKQ
jgi:O-antigen/teichoic acid export membrane protein